ncbi:hypothetical protein A4X13_0g1234 [Tilletia indica]|uniref:Uncharacterized protein n=1 Tax=Tilletia indica TaxID=43049 RepID=A0A177TXD6_9BASI|nr:hypothetical protein A4X13_0g1234 [Tilletia indica]
MTPGPSMTLPVAASAASTISGSSLGSSSNHISNSSGSSSIPRSAHTQQQPQEDLDVTLPPLGPRSSRYCSACDTPVPSGTGFITDPNPLALSQSSSRDTPFPVTPTEAAMLLCVECRRTLLNDQPADDDIRAREPASFESRAQGSHSRLSSRSLAPNEGQLPSSSVRDASHSTHSVPSSSDRVPLLGDNALDHVHSPMSLDRQTHSSGQPSSSLDFGPHLMSRPRISTLPQPPHERVAWQQPIEVQGRPYHHIGYPLRSSARFGRSEQGSQGFRATSDMGSSMHSAATHLVPALGHPYSGNDGPATAAARRQEPYRTFYDAGRPDPLQDVTYIRRIPTSRGCLHPGARFEGSQTSDKSSYGVTVIFTHVDLEASHLCGTINIRGLTEDWPELITFFDAEIIGLKHGFVTGKWGASETQDAKHWGRFAPFKPLRKFLDKPDLRFDHFNKPYVFMRWKERFLVPDHRVKNVTGASYDGFYYVCLALDPEEGDPVLPLPLHESTRTLPTSRYPSAANSANAPRASVPQLADIIMNSPTGRIPSTYSPSWNPATSYMSRTMASLRHLEAVSRGGDGHNPEPTYIGSGGPTVASATANLASVAPEEVGIAAYARTLARGSLSATAAGLVPTQPQPRSGPVSLAAGHSGTLRASAEEGGTGAGGGGTSGTAATPARRTFTSRTTSGTGAWVEVTEMEVEVEADSGSASDSTATPSAGVDAGADAVCDPPATSVQVPAADQDVVLDGPAGVRSASVGRQSSRGLLDATLTQSGTRPRQGPTPSTERGGVDDGVKSDGVKAGPSPREAVVGRCVGYYYSEQSEPFQQISLRYVPERPIGSFELR